MKSLLVLPFQIGFLLILVMLCILDYWAYLIRRRFW